ncbi:putative methyltransferase [Marinibacterium anthonyi]|nr:putative methyltransferase [Marinibacterium anthonyi]
MNAHDMPKAAAFRPSAYSAVVLRQLLALRDRLPGARVLDIGCGSGVLLAGAARLGATSLCGIDIEPAAADETARLLGTLDEEVAIETWQGSLYDPVAGRRFDVILANLPHFPMDTASVEDRLSTWSCGGDNGRRLLDPVIAGIGEHLEPDGFALVAHNAFVGLDQTLDYAATHGLKAQVVDGILTPIAPEKLLHMTPQVLAREAGRTIHDFGGHIFADVAVVLIEPAGSAR